MYDMFFDDYKYDDGEFTEICDLEKLKEIQKTRKGQCAQENGQLYIDMYKDMWRHGITPERVGLTLRGFVYSTPPGCPAPVVFHAAVVYIKDGVMWLEDKSNGIHMKVKFKKWLKTISKHGSVKIFKINTTKECINVNGRRGWKLDVKVDEAKQHAGTLIDEY